MTTSECSVEGCSRPRRSRGWCGTHYARWQRHGEVGPAELQHAVSYDGRACSVEGCGNRPRSKGLCNRHAKRLVRWGSATGVPPREPAYERFMARVDKNGPQPPTFQGRGVCWQWAGGLISSGYGMTTDDDGSRVPKASSAARQEKP